MCAKAEVEAGMNKAHCFSCNNTMCGKRVFAGIKEAELQETN